MDTVKTAQNRLVRLIPFSVITLLLISPLLLIQINFNLFSLFLIVLILYALYRTVYFSAGALIGFYKYTQENKIDWSSKLKKITNDYPVHGFSIPVYEESVYTVIRLLISISNQNYDLNKIYIVVSVEERRKGDVNTFIDDLKSKSKNNLPSKFYNQIKFVSHRIKYPEVPGAASNRTYATKELYKTLKTNNESIKHTLITSPDVDSEFAKNYCARTSVSFIKNNYDTSVFYQTGAYFFNNRNQSVPFFTNTVRFINTFAIFADATLNAKYRYTFSCFTMPLQMLLDSNYWDVKIPIDDTPLYWRIISARNQTIKCESIFTSVTVDSIVSDSFLNTAKQQYKQMHRWSWGIIAYPNALKAIFNINSSFLKKLAMFLKLHEIILLVKIWPHTLSVALLVYLQHSGLQTALTIQLLQLASVAFTINIIIIYSLKTYINCVIEKQNLLYYLINTVLEVVFGFIIGIAFGLLPDLHAYIQLAISHDKIRSITWAPKICSNLQ